MREGPPDAEHHDPLRQRPLVRRPPSLGVVRALRRVRRLRADRTGHLRPVLHGRCQTTGLPVHVQGRPRSIRAGVGGRSGAPLLPDHSRRGRHLVPGGQGVRLRRGTPPAGGRDGSRLPRDGRPGRPGLRAGHRRPLGSRGHSAPRGRHIVRSLPAERCAGPRIRCLQRLAGPRPRTDAVPRLLRRTQPVARCDPGGSCPRRVQVRRVRRGAPRSVRPIQALVHRPVRP